MDASISVCFYRSGSTKDVVEILLRYGWSTYEQPFIYEHYADSANMGDEREVENDEMPLLLEALGNKRVSGDTVCFRLGHKEKDIVAKFCYTPNNFLNIWIYTGRPILKDSGLLTDFNSLASVVVSPFLQEGFGVLSVQYFDDNT